MFFLVERYFAVVWLLNDENMQHSMLDLICGRATADAPAASHRAASARDTADLAEEDRAARRGGVQRGAEAAARRAGVERGAAAGRLQSREKAAVEGHGRRVSLAFTSSAASSFSPVPPTPHRRSKKPQETHSTVRYETKRLSATAASLSSSSAAARLSKSSSSLLCRGSVASLAATEELQDAGDDQLLQQQQQLGMTAGSAQRGEPAFETVGVHAKMRLSVDSLANFSPRLPTSRKAADACVDTTKREGGVAAVHKEETAAHTAGVGANVDPVTDSVSVGGTCSAGIAVTGSSAVGIEDEDTVAAVAVPPRRHSVAVSMLLGDAYPRRAAVAAAPRRHSTSSAHTAANATVTAASLAGHCFADTFVDASQHQQHGTYWQKLQQQGIEPPQLQCGKHQLQEKHQQELFRRRVLRKPVAVLQRGRSSITSNSSFPAVDALWGASPRLTMERYRQQQREEQQPQRPNQRVEQQGKQEQVRARQRQQAKADSQEQPRRNPTEGDSLRQQQQRAKRSDSAESSMLLQGILQQDNQLSQHQRPRRKQRSRRRESSHRSNFAALGTEVGVAAAE